MIQSLLKAANKQQQGQPGGRNSMHPGYTSGTTRNRRSPARSASWKDCFRREKVAGMNFFDFSKAHFKMIIKMDGHSGVQKWMVQRAKRTVF